jgi:hypothetical protein
MPHADGIGAVGRVIYTRRAMPAVELVNFALDRGDIAYRGRGGRSPASSAGEITAGEVRLGVGGLGRVRGWPDPVAARAVR